MSKKILITGCGGFIGREAWKFFADRGYSVMGYDNLSRPGSKLPVNDIRVCCKGDVLKFMFEWPVDVVLHLAAQVSVVDSVADPEGDAKTNILGTLRMAEYARWCGAKMIYASSNKVFGEMPGRAMLTYDQQPMKPQTPYGISKAAGAMYVRDMLPNTGYVFHQSCIYGESQTGSEDQGWVAWVRHQAAAGIPLTCFGDGSQVRDLLHVHDLLRAYEMAIDGTLKPNSYVIGGGDGNAFSFNEVVNLFHGKIGEHKDWRPHDQRYFVSANSGLTLAGWQPMRAFVQMPQMIGGAA